MLSFTLRLQTLLRTVCALACGLPGCSDDTGAGGGGSSGSGAGGAGGEGAGSACSRPAEPPSIAWEPCYERYECTTVDVPLDYDGPATGTVGLRVLRARAKCTPEGVMFVNQGGPGGPSVAWLANIYPAAAILLPQVAERYDVVAIDWRGVGESEALSCDFAAADAAIRQLPLHPASSADLAAWDDAWLAYASSCADSRQGALRARMGTATAARDLDSVRAALGEERINFLGLSYGGYLGAAYMSMFPARVRAVVLDSPSTPTPDVVAEVGLRARAIEGRFDGFFQWCGAATPEECPFHGGEGDAAVRDALDAWLATLEASGGQPVGDRTLTRFDAGKAVYPRIVQHLDAAVAQDLAAAVQGDGSGLLLAADQWFAVGESPSYLDIYCSDGRAAPGTAATLWSALAQIEQDAPHAAFDYGTFYGVCAEWPYQDPPIEISAPGAPPALIVAGTDDVWVPRGMAEETKEALGNGSYFLLGDAPDHVQTTQSKCVQQVVDAFLVDPETAPTTSDCAAR